MQAIIVVVVLATLLPSQVYASDICGPLEASDQIQMVRNGYADLVPIVMNGVAKNFLFDTGGYYTQVSPRVADDLKLPVTQGKIQITDAAGRVSRDQASVREFIVGNRRATALDLPISPVALPIDGILALDHWASSDLDVDFGTDMLTISPQGHCATAVKDSPAGAIIPITMHGFHIYVLVTLDGHEQWAAIDTGQNLTSLKTDNAKRLFNLDLGSEETPEVSGLNGDMSLKVYTHIFNSLAMGGLTFHDPKIAIVPSLWSDNAGIPQPGTNPTKTETDAPYKPDVIIGMDVMRQLRIHFAFGEKKMYVTAASGRAPAAAPGEPMPAMPVAPDEGMSQWAWTEERMAAAARKEVQSAYKKSAAQKIAELDHLLSSNPDNVQALSDRCFTRATVRANLDAALADCEQALRLMPGDAHILEVQAFVLYQKGDYKQALDAYDAMLATGTNVASVLFMRGIVKGRLDDIAGKDADIAAAKAIQPNIELVFKPFDMSD